MEETGLKPVIMQLFALTAKTPTAIWASCVNPAFQFSAPFFGFVDLEGYVIV